MNSLLILKVSQDLHIPEEPMQERVTFFDNLPEPETEVIDPEKDVFSRLDAVSRLIQDFDPLAGTDLGPSGERPKIRDFHRAYLKGQHFWPLSNLFAEAVDEIVQN